MLFQCFLKFWFAFLYNHWGTLIEIVFMYLCMYVFIDWFIIIIIIIILYSPFSFLVSFGN